jgi:FtsP/CotA-like multicopper oxidase with cupredoxin domain
MFVVEDPNDEPADRELALIFHDVPKLSSLGAAERGVSNAPMTDPAISGDSMQMMHRSIGDEVAYIAHCINGASYPHGKTLAIRSGDRVRLRILNASPTQTRYVRLAEHELVVTHADGNPLAQALTVDVLRVGAAERYDAYFEVRKPGRPCCKEFLAIHSSRSRPFSCVPKAWRTPRREASRRRWAVCASLATRQPAALGRK